MRIFLLLMSFVFILFASPKDIQTFNSKFVQTVTDSNGKKIQYQGNLLASKPHYAFWMYQKPIQKNVYIVGQKITIIEPQLEQVTIRTLDEEINLLQVFQQAKLIDQEHYSANVKGQKYLLTFKNNLLNSVEYLDTFDNKVLIKFLNPIQNESIDSGKFKPSYPSSYDVIRG